MIDLKFAKITDTGKLDAEIAAQLAKGGKGRFFGVSGDPEGVDDKARTIVHLPDDATADEIALIGSLIDAHDVLPEAREARIGELRAACKAYIFGVYDEGSQASLLALWSQALAKGYTDRAAYIEKALGWIDSILAYYYTTKDEILASDAPPKVTWDFAQFDASIPDTTLRDARGMTS